MKAYTYLALTTTALFAQDEDCCSTYCLGPTNYGINAPVVPRTCNGDFEITAAGFYWKPHQEGLEYAILTKTSNSLPDSRGQLVKAEYQHPNFDWDFGFKLGLGYNSSCDGWDVSILWTRFETTSSSHVEAEDDDNQTLLTLWSFDIEPGMSAPPLSAREIRTNWSLNLNLIDLELGRFYWNSPKVVLHPHVGIRIGYIDQDYDLFQALTLNNQVFLRNDFHSAGLLAGLDGRWHIGCGFALYGDFAFSANAGKFNVRHTEQNRETSSPFSKTRVMETNDHIRAMRLFSDLEFGIQYSTLFSDCQYALTLQLGWEQHHFANLNQFWRVVRQRSGIEARNNIFNERRGDLGAIGWTLKAVFDF